MTNEIGTLKELNLQSGDVVALVGEPPYWITEGEQYTVMTRKDRPNASDMKGDIWAETPMENWVGFDCDWSFRIVSRAKPPVDLTKLHAPFALLDEAYGEGTQEALKAHGGPYQAWDGYSGWFDINSPVGQFDTTIYRVKPEPTILKCTAYREIILGDDTINLKVTYNRIDGEIDPSSITVSPYK